MKTTTFTVNNIGDMEAVRPTINCRRVIIGESPAVDGWPTTDYLVKGTAPDSVAVRRPLGTLFEFIRDPQQSGFQAGEIIGYVETVEGTTTFFQMEQ